MTIFIGLILALYVATWSWEKALSNEPHWTVQVLAAVTAMVALVGVVVLTGAAVLGIGAIGAALGAR